MIIVFAEPIGLSSTLKKSFADEMSVIGHTVKYHDDLPVNQVDLINRASIADILVVSNYKVSEEVIENARHLKLIAVAFTGVDHIPMNLCRSKGILVCNAAGYSTQAVAELTIAMAIDLLRRIVSFDSSTRSGGTRNGFLGGELKGKTFGVIGLGAIGERVAKLANAFDCKVVAWSRTKKIVEGVDFLPFDELLERSDIVSLHLPLNESTRGLINAKSLELMKPTAILINTARGPIVDYAALTIALIGSKIAGAAIDVYEHEPPIEDSHSLFSAPNTILLPHIGFATKEAVEERSGIVLLNIKNWITGNPTNTL